MTRRELERISGVSSTAISHVEEGKGQPRTDTIEKLAIALKVSPAWLAFGQGERDLF
jgi:transcriptional regulator with XRE-family HTH domain